MNNNDVLMDTKAARIRLLRQMAGLSQFTLSTWTGVCRTRVSLIENGHVDPTAEEFKLISEVLTAAVSERACVLVKLASQQSLVEVA